MKAVRSDAMARHQLAMFSTLPVFFLLLATVHCGKDRPVFSDDVQEILDVMHAECVERTGVSEDDIQNCEKGIFKDDEKLKCYMLCLLDEATLVDEGQVDYDMLTSMMPENVRERTHKMLYACKHLDTPDKPECQRVFDVHKCSYETDPDLYFIG